LTMVPLAGSVLGEFVIGTLAESVAHLLFRRPRNQEAGSEEKERFRWAEKRTRKLLAGLRGDLSREGMNRKREFTAFKVSRGYKGPLVYTPDDCPRLDDQLEVLLDHGYIRKVSELPFAARFRMSEEFVGLLVGGE
jgi:hypothetical protein